MLIPWLAASMLAFVAPSVSVEAAPARDPRVLPRWSAEVRAFFSLHEPAFGFAAEAQVTWNRVGLGLGAEINPWIGTIDASIHPGTFNPYVSVQHRLPLSRVILRQRVSLGMAVLLEDVLGHRGGQLGVFGEFVPLGAEFHHARKRVAFVVDGFSVAIPVVAPHPIPLVQIQYRLTCGVRF